MTLIPWSDLRGDSPNAPSPIPEPVRNIARGLRDGYCEVVPRIPLVRDTPFHRVLGGAICQGTEHPPTYVGGQCPQEYRVQVLVEGIGTNGFPKRSFAPQTNPVRVWGPILDTRTSPSGSSSTRWNAEVLAYGRETSQPTPEPVWSVIGSTDVGFNRSFPATVISVTAVPEPGNPDDCAIEPVIPPGDIIQPGQPVFEININPQFDITLPPIIAPVTVLAPIIAPRFQIDLGDNTTVDVEFTFEGIEIIDNSRGDTINLGDNVITQVNNNTNQQINNLTQEIDQSITNNNNQLVLDISTEVGGAITQNIDNSLTQYFTDNPVDVDIDLTPVFQRFDIVDQAIADIELEVDFTEVLERIELAELTILEETGLRFDDVDDVLECLVGAQPDGEAFNTVVQIFSGTSTHENSVFTVPGFTNGSRFALLQILSFNPSAVRTYKLSGSESDIEAGFGHVSRLLFESPVDFRVVSTLSTLCDLRYVPEGVTPKLRVSLKPGISFRVLDFRYFRVPFTCD